MLQDNERLQEMVDNGHARRMGHIENYFGLLQRQNIYKTFSVIARFNTKVYNKALLFHALRPLLLKYPTLAATIVNTDYSDITTPRPIHDYIKVIENLKLKDFLYEIPDEIKNLKGAELMKALNEIELPYADNNTLWKLAFLDDYTMVYITNHCLSDGITAKYLLQDLENQFEQIPIEKLTTEDDYDSKILLNYNSDKSIISKLPPPLDSVIKYSPPLWYIPEYFYNLFFIKKLCYSSGTVATSDKHSYRTVHIPSETLSQISKRLKSNESDKKITMTPFIQAAWLNAQYKSGMLTNFSQMTDFSLPCNARQYIPSGVDHDQFKYGANTSGSHKYFWPVKKLTWSVVGYFNDYTKYIFKTKRFLYNMGIITMDIIAKNQNLDKLIKEAYVGQQRGGTVFSNLGLVLDSSNKKYRIQDISFFQNAGTLIFTFALCCVACVDGGLNLAITMAENAVSEDMFDSMVKHFEENLLSEEIEAN